MNLDLWREDMGWGQGAWEGELASFDQCLSGLEVAGDGRGDEEPREG